MATSEKRSTLAALRQYVKEFNPTEGTQEDAARNESKAWKDWIENLEMCMEFEEIEETKKLQALKILGGKHLREKISTLTEANTTYEECKTKLAEHFEDKRSINAIRNEFFNVKQRKEETTKQYAERCKKIGKECEFENFKLEDAIILNICQYTPIEKLRSEILVKELNYNQTIKYGTSLETAAKESARMKKNNSQEEFEIERIRKGGYSKPRVQKQTVKNTCSRCGRYQPHTCRALQATCYKCNNIGHFANMCKTRKVQQLEQEDSEESTEETSEESTEEY